MFQTQSWGQQQQLPFDPTYVNQSQLVSVQPGQPPVNIQVQTHPNLEPYVPFISSLLINEIQTAVQVNPNNLRIFMFNQMSRQYYNNQDYAELLQLTTNWVLLHVMRANGNVDPSQVAQQLVPQICQMRAAANCAAYQPLLGYIDQSMQLEAQNGFRAFQQTVSEVSRFIQQLTRPQQPQSFGMGMQSGFGGGGGNPGMGGSSTGLFSSNQQAQPTTTGTRFDNSGGGNNPYEQQLREMRTGGQKQPQGGFGGVLNQGVQPRQSNTAAVVEEFGSGIPNRGFGAAPAQPTTGNWSAAKTPDQGEKIEATVLTGEVKWKRSNQQPYHPAWNPKTQTIVYVEANGDVLAVPTQKPHNAMNEPLDYDRHSIGRVPQGAPIIPKSTSLEDAIVSRELDPAAPIDLVTNETITLDTHEVSAAISAGLEAFAKGVTRRDHAAYRSLRFIAEPLYFQSDEIAEKVVKKLTEISESRTLRRVQEILQRMDSPEELGVQIRLDRILTREVNDALAMNLGIVMRIDSFMVDYGDIDGYLRSKHGNRLADVLREHEIDMLTRAIEVFDGPEATAYANNLLEEIPEDQRVPGRILFLVKRVTFTHLSESAHELNLALKGSTASLLTEAGHPALYKLAQELFDNATIKENSYARHYFITTDGVKLCVDRGWLNKDATLIKLED